jgi:hypothetical protein
MLLNLPITGLSKRSGGVLLSRLVLTRDSPVLAFQTLKDVRHFPRFIEIIGGR